MTESDDSRGTRVLRILTGALSAAAGAAVGLATDPVAGAVSAVGLEAGAASVLRQCARAVAARPGHVLDRAAQLAGIGVDELADRLAEVPGGEDLLIKTIGAAMRVAAEQKLVALSVSLGRAATERTEVSVTFKSQFVAAVGDLDHAHWEVLTRFERTANDLGLGDGSAAFDAPSGVLNRVQLDKALPGLIDLVSALLPGLERYGLLEATVPYSTAWGGGSAGPRTWNITPFGHGALARLREVQDLLAEQGNG